MTYSVKKKGQILAAAMLLIICILSFAGISRASDQGIRVDYADLNLCDDNAAYTHYIIVGLSGDMDKITTCNLTLKGEDQEQNPIFYRKDGQSLVFYYRLPMGDYSLSTFSYNYDGKQYTADMTELSKKNELIDTELSVSLTDEERALIEEKAGALSSFLTPTVSRCAAVTSIGESRLQASVIGKKLGEGKYVVVIDPGHGGKCGASRTINGIKYYEDDFTLKIGNYIQAELANYSDITVLMTRTTDTNVSFESRCNLAGDNGAVLLVSLHLNATATTTTDTHGAEAIYQNSNYNPEVAAKSKEIAEIMVRGLESIGLTYRSIYYKNGASKFDDGSIADNFAINRMCKLVGVPGIILEHCFLNNMSDFENFLSTEDKVMALGVADAKSIVSYLGAGETASGELGAAKISKIVANGSTASVTFSYTGTMTPSGYALYRSLSKDGEYTKVATAVATAKNVKDSSMEYGVTYYYKVVPYSDRADGYKEGTASEVVSTYRCQAPSINTLERSGEGYMLMWDAVEGANSYTIQRATVTGGTFSTLASSTSNSYVDTTAKAGTEYIYRVRAVKSYNSVSNYSSYSTARFVGVSSLEVMPDGASALVSWSDLSYATGFKIYRKAVTASSYSLIATLSRAEGLSYLDTGIASSTAYDYKIYAYVTIGSSSYMSLPKLATFIGTLETGKITGLKTGSSGAVTISYSEIPGVSGYEIYRKSEINGTASLVGTVAAGTLTYLDETASSGKAYFYAVRGYVKGSTATGYSELSDYLLSGPYLKAAVSYSDTENKINWTPQDNVSGYKIYRKTGSDGSYKLIKTITTVDSYTYTDTKLTAGTAYYYRVRSFIEVEVDGKKENKLSKIIDGNKAVPTKGPEVTSAGVSGSNKITVSYTKVTGVKGYRIYRKVHGSTSSYKKVGEVSGEDSLSFTDTSVDSSKTYDYMVRGFYKENGQYGYTGYSEAMTSNIGLESIEAVSATSVKLSWSKSLSYTGIKIYRKKSTSSKYSLIKTLNISTGSYTDTGLTAGTSYDYKVIYYTTKNGKTTNTSPYITSITTMETPVISSCRREATGGILVKWGKITGASGYQIYRSTNASSGFVKVASVSGASTTSYTDKEATDNVIYYYKVRVYVKKDGKYSYSDKSKVFISSPAAPTLTSKSSESCQISFTALTGAKSYNLYRMKAGESSWTLVTTLDAAVTSYLDEGLESGASYDYRVSVSDGSYTSAKSNSPEAFTLMKKISGLSVYMTSQFGNVELKWTLNSDATAYRIYRKAATETSYEKVGEVTGNTFTDETAVKNSTYSYKIRAIKTVNGVTNFSSYSDEVSITVQLTEIMGKSMSTRAQVVAYFNKSGKKFPTTYASADKGSVTTIEQFVDIIFEEAEAEGLKADMLAAQIFKETGFLQFGGDVKASQCNFGGLGATGGGAGGATFENVRMGIRAQVQHLKAYALENPELKYDVVDPRFNLVTKGCAPFIEWLGVNENPTGKGWATASRYGYSIVTIMYAMKEL